MISGDLCYLLKTIRAIVLQQVNSQFLKQQS